MDRFLLIWLRNRLLRIATFVVGATLFGGLTIAVASLFKSVALGGVVGIGVAFAFVYLLASRATWLDELTKRWDNEEAAMRPPRY